MKADLALAAVALIWGATFVLVKDALTDITPDLFLAWRFSIAAILLGTMHVARNGWNIQRDGGLKIGVLAGAVLFTGYLLQTLGLRWTTPAKSGFVTGLYIVLVPIVAAAVYRRAPRLIECLGVVVATIGMALMTVNFDNLEIGKGDVLTIFCAMAFTVHILLLGHYAKRQDAGWLAFLQIATCAAAAWIAMPLVEAPQVRWTRAVVIAIGVTSVFATALAFFIQTWGQRHTTPTRAALIFALEPVFAWITSFLVTGEVFTKVALAGAGLILAGILLVESQPTVSTEPPA